MLQSYKNNLLSRLKSDERSTTIGFTAIALLLGLILGNIVYLNLISFKKNVTVKSIKTVDAPLPSILPSPTEIPTPTNTIPTVSSNNSLPTASSALIRDNFIPLGSGSIQSTEWKDVPGTQATVDFSQYSPIKEIRFEASVNVPTGNETVSVRLYNVTDKHPVWYSEVTTASNTNSYLTSSPLVFDFGSKLYQVQMKTQLQFPANLTQARIHVVSN